MKSIINISAMLMCGVALLASCDDDRENNPTLLTPQTFKLNAPAYANTDVDLASATSLAFSWSQPNYGVPVAAEYQLQVSVKDSWTTSIEQMTADESGKTQADYGSVGQQVTSVTNSVNAADLAKALEQIAKWPEGSVPASQSVFVRCMAVYAGDTIYSNTQTIKVNPYYVELRDAEPDYWYLIGGTIGDGKWTNTPEALGTSMIPLYPITGESYDKKTGTGTFSWTGYLTASQGFKMVHVLGKWDEQIGSSDGSPANVAWNDGGSSDIKVPEDGIYTVTLNAVKKQLSVEKYSGNATVYETMSLRGQFNNWGKTDMSPVFTFAGAQNHDWTYNLTIAADGKIKFDGPGDWGATSNWGSTEWHWGTGTVGGGDIPAKAGKYKVFFNDITGQFNFIPQE